MSVITDCPYICAPNIMDTPDYQTKMVTLDMTGQTVIKAGTPISAEGKVANDETAIGILLNDCHACLGARRGLVVVAGRIKQDVAAEHSGVAISDEAKSAMINLTFTGDGARAGGAGGASTWDDLGTTKIDITWDGNTEGRETFSLGEGIDFCKVSDSVLTVDDLDGAEMQLASGASFTISTGSNVEAAGTVCMVVNQSGYVLAAFVSDNEYGSAGVYSICDSTNRMERLSFRFVVPIPEEYLPDSVTTATELVDFMTEVTEETTTLTFDGSTDGLDTFIHNAFSYYKVSDFCPEAKFVADWSNKVVSGGIQRGQPPTVGEKCYGCGKTIVVTEPGTCKLENMRFTAPSTGTYLRWDDGNVFMQCAEATFVTKAVYPVIITNGKRYRLKVDDSGALSATEVTD